MGFAVYVGIDVSKSFFDVAIRDTASSHYVGSYSNDSNGIKEFLNELKKYDPSECLICLEHTGIYTHLLLQMLCAKKFKLWLEQAINIKKSLGNQRGKNDQIDALRIAEYAFRFKDKCTLWQPPRKELIKLKNLVSLRNRLIKVKKMLAVPVNESAGIPSTMHKDIKKINAPVLNQINCQLKEIEDQIEATIQDDSHLNKLHEIVTSVDGVGKVTSWQIIICTNEFKDFANSRKFACYSGVVPFDHSSGISINNRPRVSHMANKKMKELLHLSALSATVMKGELNDYYLRKVREGKNKMLVLNNIRNKLIHRIFKCVQENRKYEKSYINSLA